VDNFVDNSKFLNKLWSEIYKILAQKFSPFQVDLWLSQFKPLSMENNVLKLEYTNQVIRDKVHEKYENDILEALKSLMMGEDCEIVYIQGKPVPADKEKQKPEPAEEIQKPQSQTKKLHPDFNPNFTFDTFIEGTSNRFALASAKALVNNGKSPFFIYSAPGLGKTHLLHAIAHGIYAKNNSARILYMDSEGFVNEFIDAIRGKAEENFRNRYRHLDCLLLDDVQFLLGREKSTEEFFHTFNSLFQTKKTIVIASDRPPRELAMENRIITRLLQGTVADIKAPDFETRMAILKQKIHQNNMAVSDEIITFIAENVTSSIRELEGCLNTVENFCTTMKMTPTLDTVKEILKDHISESQERKITIEEIKKIVAKKYSIDVKDLSSKRRTANLVMPRQIAMYLCSALTDKTLKEIGLEFSKDHATVISARDKMKEQILNDPFISANINAIISDIKKG